MFSSLLGVFCFERAAGLFRCTARHVQWQGSFDELTYKYTRNPQTDSLTLHCTIKILALGLFEGDHESLRPDDLCIS